MKRLEFSYIELFIAEILEMYDSLGEENRGIEIIAKYNEAKEIVENLILCGKKIHSIKLEDSEWSNYTDEFSIILYDDEIWCEKYKLDGKYLTTGASVSYILDDCNSKVISNCMSDVKIEVGIGDEDEIACPYTYDCADCDMCSEDGDKAELTSRDEETYVYRLADGTPRGFEKSWNGFTEDGLHCESSFKHFSTDVEELSDLAEKFGIKF